MKTLKIIRNIAAILAELSLLVLVVYYFMQADKNAWTLAIIFGLFFGISIPFNWKDFRKQETRSELVRPIPPQNFYGKALLSGFLTVSSIFFVRFRELIGSFYIFVIFLGLFFTLSYIILYKFRKQIED